MTKFADASRRRFVQAVAATALWPVAAHAGFNFFTNEYTATIAELQNEIEKHFPLAQRYAELFTVGLRDPQLGLNARTNRAAITATLSIASPLLLRDAIPGVVSVSSALRYDPSTRSLKLDQPKAERLSLQGIEGQDAQRLQQVGAVVAQELLRDQVLRRFKPEELTVGRKTYEIGAITVLDSGIRVQLS